MKEARPGWNQIKKTLFSEKRTLSLVLLLIGLMAIMSFLNPHNFPTLANVRSMMLQMSETGMFTPAMYIIMISGGLNLSIVSVANFSAACMASVTTGALLSSLPEGGMRIAVGIVLALVVGASCGVVNGFFVSKLGLNALLVTSASSQLFEGAAQLITKGGSIVSSEPGIVQFGNGSLLGFFPNIFVITIICYIVAALFANETKYGETSRLLGANETANLYCGNNNVRTLLTSYILSGVFSAIGGMIAFTKMGIVRSEYGSTLSTQALLTLVLAGLLVIGGTGKVINVLLSLCILQVVSSGFNLAGINTYLKSVVWGVLLMAIVIMNTQQASDLMSKIRRWGKTAIRGKAGNPQ